MNNRWKTIWNGKSAGRIKDLSEFEAYKELKKADGFDVAVEEEKEYYQSFYNEWLDFYDKITGLCGKLGSVYEVGCGSGVNLYMFANRGINKLAGIDYSESLVKNAREITGSDEIVCDEAKNLCTDTKYDLVMSESVFQYFTDLDYAETVIRKMIDITSRCTYIGEMHDAEFEEELMEYRKKTIPNYDEEYKGLSKLFFTKEWVKRIADEYDKKVVFTKVNNPHYLNSKYQFNCLIY